MEKNEARKCRLTNDELIAKTIKWVHDLAETGGRKWTLSVPVNFNTDPDILFIELGERLKLAAQEVKGMYTAEQVSEIIEMVKRNASLSVGNNKSISRQLIESINPSDYLKPQQ